MKKEKKFGAGRELFSELNEAKAYNFLVRSGYTSVEFVPTQFGTPRHRICAQSSETVDVLLQSKNQ